MLKESVHGLWIGKKISPVELLCMKSFIAHGHPFHLWLYGYLDINLPEGVIVEDASTMIPLEKVFAYKNTNQFGHGKGSYAGFSDIFRYKLLYEKGGWWSDMDVVCLKPLDFSEEFVFRMHHDYLIVGNLMKCPENSSLMFDCYNEASLLVNENNTDWNLPIAILNKNLIKHQLQSYIKDISNPDKWLFVRTFLFYNISIKDNWYALHLMNEEWRKNKINKFALPKWSLIGKLFIRYDLFHKVGNLTLLMNLIKIIFPKYNFYYSFNPFLRLIKKFLFQK